MFGLVALAFACLGSLSVQGAKPAVAPRASSVRVRKPLTVAQLEHLKTEIFARERAFFRAGVAYDEATGMSFDGHPIDLATGHLTGAPRSFSAPSKESLHLILLAKAIAGDRDAQRLLAPDPAHPAQATPAALEVLAKKMSTYERFDTEFPGFGGFLPWFDVGHGKIVPTRGWADRVPSLDNGQLAWSLYLVASTLAAHGAPALAARYGAHLDRMKRNVVSIFYDPAAGKLRTEAKLGAGAAVAPSANRYLNNQPKHFLDDDKEGLLMAHFADLFGAWTSKGASREALWKERRRVPVTRKGLTVVAGDTFSSHEDWGFLVLPYRDVPIADALFVNAQKARTRDAAEHGWSGLRAATHRPIASAKEPLDYVNTLGVAPFARGRVTGAPFFAPYAAFPLALAQPRVFGAWLGSMLDAPRMWGPNGIGESYAAGGKRIAPILTWDGKALLLIAMMGGISSELRTQLKQDGLYDKFLARTREDYRGFERTRVLGKDLAWSLPAKQ